MKPARLVALVAMVSIVGTMLALPFACVGMTLGTKPVLAGEEARRVVHMELAFPEEGGIIVGGPINLEWSPGAETKIEFRGDKAIVKYCRAEVVEDSIKIWLEDAGPSFGDVTALVSSPQPRSVSSSGSGDVTLSGLSGGRLKFSIAGSGDGTLEGALDALDVSIAGSGSLDAEGLSKLGETDVSIAGSGDVDLPQLSTLKVSIAGSGSVTYDGEPKVSSTILGSGAVRRR
ncbi:MAG: DUF2807 domain-containing protein [Fimbriimonadaceae bacterium]|nr:DUF2807 domain-containing protein [Fimbriimonadaceae bacterium]QYK55446.1 MAG: DUF2807 domain-containing protein [Fimbriimonadaceae bacterium]